MKAQHCLKNKSQSVALMTNIYAESFLEPELIHEYLRKLEGIRKGKYKGYNSFEEFERSILK